MDPHVVANNDESSLDFGKKQHILHHQNSHSSPSSFRQIISRQIPSSLNHLYVRRSNPPPRPQGLFQSETRNIYI